MSSYKKEGGPAFSVPLHQGRVYSGHALWDGMTLRDYFAAKAMQGFIAGHIAHYGHENHWPWSGIADSAYEVADAMLEQRAKGAA